LSALLLLFCICWKIKYLSGWPQKLLWNADGQPHTCPATSSVCSSPFFWSFNVHVHGICITWPWLLSYTASVSSYTVGVISCDRSRCAV
jgi:hypothetical protein